ncbi:MAG TPA: dihydroorotate dehydrogenase electron transfer subunit [Clostridiales bacterium]|nr:dihydroorotate dehydrogenase electron transfer subunit [Clostridiales bacterium]
MKKALFKILSNEPIAKDVYKLVLEGDTGGITAPGQFVNIELEGFFLRRPISVCDWDDKGMTLIYKTVGKGTKCLSEKKSGTLDLLTGLGNGFDLSKCGKRPLLVGGGVGTPPLYGLCKRLVERGAASAVVLGFNTADDVFYEEEFRALGVKTLVATVDGSYGIGGLVTDAIKTLPVGFDSYCACGPEPMLRALCDTLKIKGQLSFEERMACGFGVCMGCSCKTKYGSKRICKDGPVLSSNEVIW